MTIDKIKHYMGAERFNYWASVRDREIMAKAEKELSYEIENNKHIGIQYHAELHLLRYLLR